MAEQIRQCSNELIVRNLNHLQAGERKHLCWNCPIQVVVGVQVERLEVGQSTDLGRNRSRRSCLCDRERRQFRQPSQLRRNRAACKLAMHLSDIQPYQIGELAQLRRDNRPGDPQESHFKLSQRCHASNFSRQATGKVTKFEFEMLQQRQSRNLCGDRSRQSVRHQNIGGIAKSETCQ